jgi:hypothetical protein
MSVIRVVYHLAACAFLAGSFGEAQAAVNRDTTRKLLQDLPIFFEPNEGQWNPQVKFSARTGDYRLFLTTRDALLSYSRPGDSSPRLAGFSLLNANRAPAVEGVDPLPSHSNYFVGRGKQGWHTGVAHYGRVRYREVYPGIDVVYYGNPKQLEYDFVLQPGADPRMIRLKFSGAGRLKLTPGGDLLLEDGGTRLMQQRPDIYQGDRRVSGKYRLLGRNVVGIEVGSYDRSRPLTIDPVLVFASFIGGGAIDAVTAVKVNSDGILYALGYTNSTDIAGTEDAYNAEKPGGRDVFLARINPAAAGSAALLSFTFFGGTGTDTPVGLALAAKDIVCFAGTTGSTDLPLVFAQQGDLAGGTNTDAFVAKLDYNLQGADSLFYSTYLGGNDADSAAGIDVDAEGMIYVIGTTRSEDFPVTDSAIQNFRWGPQDLFIAKLNPALESSSLQYSTYLGGELTEYGEAIAVTSGGMVYFAAATNSEQFGWAGTPYRETPFGGGDMIVGQMDLTKSGQDSLVYATYFGGSGYDEPRAIALDPSGKVLVTGFTLSTDLPVTPDAHQLELRGNSDVFLARLDLSARPENFVSHLTYLGGAGGDVAYGLTADPDGNAYITGYTLSTDFPVTGDAWQREWGGGVDIFVSKLSPSGALLYSTYIGQTGSNSGYSIATRDGSIYVGGVASRKGISPTSNAFQGEYGGGMSDGFVLVFAP